MYAGTQSQNQKKQAVKTSQQIQKRDQNTVLWDDLFRWLPTDCWSTFRLSFQQTNVRKGITFANIIPDFFVSY